MDLITTHINADFDGLASMVAAKKLYPNARLVFPGSQERPVREFMSLCKDIVKIETEKECNLQDISRLVIVDTRLASRIGKMEGLINKKGLKVHIFDHHPRSKEDIKADKDVFDEVGATVTMLVELIKRRRLSLNPLEATIMILGIYEETGCLTFRTTTRKDLDMVSFLLDSGANLNVVSSHLNLSLSESELNALVQLIQSTEPFSIQGIKVAICSISFDKYEGDLAVLAHKVLEVENFHVLFVLAKIRNRIHLIGRSRVPCVDVNEIMRAFGGGGHPSAASAKIDGAQPQQIKERLIRLIKTRMKPTDFAKDIMVFPPKTLSPLEPIGYANELLLKLNLPALPVVEDGKVIGIVGESDTNKAIRRGLTHAKLKGFMSTKIIPIGLKTPIHEIQKAILENNVSILPVMKNKRLVGIVTRTDVLKTIHNGLIPLEIPSSSQKAKSLTGLIADDPEVSTKLESSLPKSILTLLKQIGEISDEMKYNSFIVGGFVRDLLLGVENFDLDIVVEGDAINLAQILAKELRGDLVRHRRFGTATVVLPENLKIDLATARSEYYERPAALPTVKFGTLKDDLYRRDFTINAMAVRLNREGFGKLFDFFAGQEDLRHRRIRILHNLSFVEDPTRIFRAIRFEQRFNFKIDKHTQNLIKKAVGLKMFERVQKQRIREELILLLSEKEPIKVIKRMAQLHQLSFIHPKIKLNKPLLNLLQDIGERLIWFSLHLSRKRPLDKWLIYLIGLFDQLNYKETQDTCHKFVFKKGDVKRILSYKRLLPRVLRTLDKRGPLRPSYIFKLLEPMSYEVILLTLAKSKTKIVEERISDFFTKYNGMRLNITGRDLKKMGLESGPQFKEILTRVLYEKIDGELKTKEDELNSVKRFLGRL